MSDDNLKGAVKIFTIAENSIF